MSFTMAKVFREECNLDIKQSWNRKKPFQGKNVLDTIFITSALIFVHGKLKVRG